MIVPAFASLAVTIVLGWLFLISGIGGLIVTFWAREMPGFWWSLISAALAGRAGGAFLAPAMQGGRAHAPPVFGSFSPPRAASLLFALGHRRAISAPRCPPL